MIPEEAIEAALIVLRRDDLWDLSDREECLAILEAAAPYMLAGAWDEGFDKGLDRGEWESAPVREEPLHTNPYRKDTE
jgi:hypothetical protein